MKGFADIFRAKKEKDLASLQRVANIAGKDHPEKWDEFMKVQIAQLLDKDDDLFEMFFNAAIADLAAELAIKPDPEHKLTGEEKLLSAVANVFTKIFDDDDLKGE